MAQTFRNAADALDQATQNMEHDLRLPDDVFLGDPYSKHAIKEFNNYFVDSENSVASTLRDLVLEHMRTFNALRSAAESYGMTDEWNARELGKAYPVQ